MIGQVSLEYMMLVAISIILAIMVYGIYYFEGEKRMRDIRAYLAIRELGRAIEGVCLEENGSKREVFLYIPVYEIEKTISENYTIGFRAEGRDYVYFSPCKVNFTGNFSWGGNLFIIEKINDTVYVRRKEV